MENLVNGIDNVTLLGYVKSALVRDICDYQHRMIEITARPGKHAEFMRYARLCSKAHERLDIVDKALEEARA